MITCAKCQKDLEEGVSSCPYCGAQIGVPRKPKQTWLFWTLPIITLVFIMGMGGYFWYVNIRSAEQFVNISSAENLAVEKYLPVYGKIESRFNAYIRNDQYKDVVVLVASPTGPWEQEQYLTVISFNDSTLKWEVIYHKKMNYTISEKANIEICRLIPGEKDQILVRLKKNHGLGLYSIEYDILGWQNNGMKTFLNRTRLDMGKVEIQGNQLLETSTSGKRIYKWVENAFVATTLFSGPIKPVGSDDISVEYQIIDDKTVSVSQNEVIMFIGQELHFVCKSQRSAARIMSTGGAWDENKRGYVAKTPSNTVVHILPTYGGWENAAIVRVSIMDYPPHSFIKALLF